MKQYKRRAVKAVCLFMTLVIVCTGCGKKKNSGGSVQESTGETVAESVNNTEASSLTTEELVAAVQSKIEDVTGETPDIAFPVSHLSVTYYDNDLQFMFGTVSSLLTQGIVVDKNTAKKLESGKMTDEIHASYNHDEFTLRIVNPSEESETVDNCFIAYCCFTGENTVLSGSFACGKSTRQEIEEYYGKPYYSDEYIDTYKVTVGSKIDFSSIKKIKDSLKDANRYSRDMILYYDNNGMLQKVAFASTEYILQRLVVNLKYEAVMYLMSEATAFAEGGETQFFETVEELTDARDKIVTEFRDELAENGLQDYSDPITGEITLSEKVLFEFDKAELTENSKTVLDKITEAYMKVLEDEGLSGEIEEIEIAGHASPEGTYDYNLDLSQRRADAVRNYCNESIGERDSKFELYSTAKGYSFSEPVFDENGDVDMEASRRVTIRIHLKVKK